MEKYRHINFVPPEGVSSEASKGLRFRQKAGDRGGLSVSQAKSEGVGSGVQRAVNLKNRDKISPNTIKRMIAFFDRHQKNKKIEKGKKPYEDKGYVAWLLWGGDPGYSWAKEVEKQMNTADKEEKIKRAGAAARVILSFYKTCLAESELEKGIDVEKEHDDVYTYFSNHLKKHDIKMPVSRDKFYEMIAKAHIKELPKYYTELLKMENKSEVKKEAMDFTSIAPIIPPKDDLDKRELSRALRLSISAEQDAVHLYELLADTSNDEKVKKLMQSVADEEKVHIYEFQKMLDSISPEEKEFKEEAEKEVKEEIGI